MPWDQADSEYVHGMPRMVDVSAALEDPGEALIQKLKWTYFASYYLHRVRSQPHLKFKWGTESW